MLLSLFYLRFMGRVSTLSCFPLDLLCEDYIFSEEAVEALDHDLDSILTDPINSP